MAPDRLRFDFRHDQAVTPDELGAAWDGQTIHRPIMVDWNGKDERKEIAVITALGDPYGSSPESTQHWFPELLQQERIRAEKNQDEIASISAVARSNSARVLPSWSR